MNSTFKKKWKEERKKGTLSFISKFILIYVIIGAPISGVLRALLTPETFIVSMVQSLLFFGALGLITGVMKWQNNEKAYLK